MIHRNPGFRKLTALPLIAAFLILWTTGVLQAQDECSTTRAPGATLLFPYFEVDLEDPDGLTTLLSIHTVAEGTPTLAHVIVWTNLGIPVLDFDLHLIPDSLTSLDMRRVLNGQLPVTGPLEGEDPFPGCTAPVEIPDLDEGAIAALQAALTGRPDPDDGLCRSASKPEGDPAIGYVTVDVLNECSETIRHPRDEGYFLENGEGIAGIDNVLWGDLILIDPSEDFAQGMTPVSLKADPELYGPMINNTFYSSFLRSGIDHRQPLGHTYRTRFLQGGAFSGGTQLVVWGAEQREGTPPYACDGEIPINGFSFHDLKMRFETGESLFEGTISTPGILTKRLNIGEFIPLPVGLTAFGSVEITSYHTPGVVTLPVPFPLQSWVFPVLQASGRYSVALDSVQLGCE